MQRSARAWAALEGIRSQAAVASVWRRACGHFHAAFSSAVLQLAAEPATLYPCPERSGYPHTICRRDDG